MESSALMSAITAFPLHTAEIRASVLAAAPHRSHSQLSPVSRSFPGFLVREPSWFPRLGNRAPPILESSHPLLSTHRSLSLAPDCRLRRSAVQLQRPLKARPQS